MTIPMMESVGIIQRFRGLGVQERGSYGTCQGVGL